MQRFINNGLCGPFESFQSQQNDPFSLTYFVISPQGKCMTFSFRYEKVGSIWRAFIVECPDYGSRSTNPVHTGRTSCTDGRYYVDWCPEQERLDDITAVSKMWAKATAKYIAMGERF